MGAQIGCENALGGHDVVLHSRDADAAHARAEAALDLVERHQLRSTEDVTRAHARVTASPVTEVAAQGADLLRLSLPEGLELKTELLCVALTASPAAIVLRRKRSETRPGPDRRASRAGDGSTQLTGERRRHAPTT